MITPRVLSNAFLGFIGVCLVAIICRFIVYPAMHVKRLGERLYGNVYPLYCSCGCWTTCTIETIDEAAARVHEAAKAGRR